MFPNTLLRSYTSENTSYKNNGKWGFHLGDVFFHQFITHIIFISTIPGQGNQQWSSVCSHLSLTWWNQLMAASTCSCSLTHRHSGTPRWRGLHHPHPLALLSGHLCWAAEVGMLHHPHCSAYTHTRTHRKHRFESTLRTFFFLILAVSIKDCLLFFSLHTLIERCLWSFPAVLHAFVSSIHHPDEDSVSQVLQNQHGDNLFTFNFDTKSRSAFFWTKSVIQSGSAEELVEEEGAAEERDDSSFCRRAAVSCLLFSSKSVSQLKAPHMRLRDLPCVKKNTHFENINPAKQSYCFCFYSVS